MDYNDIIKQYLQNGYNLSQIKKVISDSSNSEDANLAIKTYIEVSAKEILPLTKQLLEQNYSLSQLKDFLASKGNPFEVIEKAIFFFYDTELKEYVQTLISQGYSSNEVISLLGNKGYDVSKIKKSLRTTSTFANKKLVILFCTIVVLLSIIYFSSLGANSNYNIPEIKFNIETISDGQYPIGSNLEYKVIISGDISRTDPLDINFRTQLLDSSNLVISSRSFRRMVSGTTSFIERIEIPKDTSSGTANLEVSAMYSGKTFSSILPITITDSNLDSDLSKNNLTNPIDTVNPNPSNYNGIETINLENISSMPISGNSQGNIISSYESNSISSEDLAKIIFENDPSFAFYICGRLPLGELREKCLEGINLDYETLGDNDFCEEVYVFNNEQLVCLPKNETTGSCNYVMDEDAKKDCIILVSEYDGMVDLIRELLDELISGNPNVNRILVPFRLPGESIDDYI